MTVSSSASIVIVLSSCLAFFDGSVVSFSTPLLAGGLAEARIVVSSVGGTSMEDEEVGATASASASGAGVSVLEPAPLGLTAFFRTFLALRIGVPFSSTVTFLGLPFLVEGSISAILFLESYQFFSTKKKKLTNYTTFAFNTDNS